jgi:glyoxylase-like metal-dependent hydrolase (beta-lactamase superfamily II)
MEKVRSLGGGTWLIDTLFAGAEGFSSVYALRGSRGVALVDSGVSADAGNILAGLDEAGIGREEVLYIIVTHIHLDHSGGAGSLLGELPGASVVVAAAGVETLARPERLVASARRALGVIAELYGDMVPIDPGRLLAAEDAGPLDLGGRALRLVSTPGHASTHQCVVDEATGTLFSGDALGIWLEEEAKVIPVTPLPDFHLEQQRESMRLLEGLDCGRTCFAHFGCGGPCAGLALQSLDNLEKMVVAVREGVREGADPGQTAGELMRLMGVSTPYGMSMFGGMSLQNVQGITRYLARYEGGA